MTDPVPALPGPRGDQLPAMADGMYAWRVAALSKRGTVGEFGFARRIYCEDSAPADLLSRRPQCAAQSRWTVEKTGPDRGARTAVGVYRTVVAIALPSLSGPIAPGWSEAS